MTVSEAINAVQAGTHLEMVFYIYVVDDRNHLVGVASLRQLLVVPPSTPLKKMIAPTRNQQCLSSTRMVICV